MKRVYSGNVDESSCICGFSNTILDKLELIVQKANDQQCAFESSNNQQLNTSTSPPTQDNSIHQQPQVVSQIRPNDESGAADSNGSASSGLAGSWSLSGQTSVSLASKLTSEIQTLQAQLANLIQGSNLNQQQASLPQRPQSSILPDTSSRPSAPPGSAQSSLGIGGFQMGGSSSWSLPSGTIVVQANSQTPPNNNAGYPQAQRPILEQHLVSGNSGFLQGLPQSSKEPSQNQNQNHKVEAQEVQEAVVSTVPNVVSNIFTNIQDLAIQTEQDPNHVSSSSTAQLISIDGSSAPLNKNDTAAQITAQGEQLFLQWIEHQIRAYHMTASMAAYIRKSALNLFRRIVRQYVQRIERLGGAVESNVRQATQLALNNTQHLISFLLRNYLNFAGGLMQIMGEQVSRVGKQLDTTGETIAHINLNPFDIVSNVIDSLPNPSRYSEYFRAFGKYLMGESSVQNEKNSPEQHQQSSPQQDQNEDQHRGLFSKTMGALSKTLDSWIG